MEQADPGGLGVPEEALPDPWSLPLHMGGTLSPSWGLLTSEHPAAAIAFSKAAGVSALASWRRTASHRPGILSLALRKVSLGL